jgi:hypothetical protein
VQQFVGKSHQNDGKNEGSVNELVAGIPPEWIVTKLVHRIGLNSLDWSQDNVLVAKEISMWVKISGAVAPLKFFVIDGSKTSSIKPSIFS